MKKFKLFSVLAAISLVACFCLCSCGTQNNATPSENGIVSEQTSDGTGENEVKYEKIVLSTQNAAHYLAFSVTFSDCIADYIETNSLGVRYYQLSCVATIRTSRAADCYFEGNEKTTAAIEYAVSKLTEKLGYQWEAADSGTVILRASLDYYGESTVTLALQKKRSSGLVFPSSIRIDGSDLLLAAGNIFEVVKQ